MAAPNNVFRGPQSVAQYFDPDKSPPLPLVEIPNRLNPFRKDNVRIYAKLLTCLPAHNVKSLPALNMLLREPKARDTKIAEASSGSTVLSLGIIARVLWGNGDVDAYVTNKKPRESLNWLRFFGIRPCLYGGLAQQEPTDPAGIMRRLRRRANAGEDIVYLGQYDNENNWKAHEKWTGPQIFKQLPEINVFCTTVGTGGCITGAGAHLKSKKPSVRVVGVFNIFGDPTPGPRHFHGFHTCGFPWEGTVDASIEVASADSYRMSMRLSREGLIAGPSSGEALQGILQYIAQVKDAGQLAQLADETTGEISCVFTCCDLPYQYMSGYFQKLGANEFPPIENEILLQCDQTRHDERWVLDAHETMEFIFGTANSKPAQHKATISTQSLEFAISAQTRPSDSKMTTNLFTMLHSWLGRLYDDFLGIPHLQRHKCCSIHSFTQASPSALILDFRSEMDFRARHLPGSYCASLEGLTPELAHGDLFGDANTVHFIWSNIQSLLDQPRVSSLLQGARKDHRTVIVVCYNGDASQLGSSTLRDRELEAFNVKEGFEKLWAVYEGAGLV
ncbi:hypothetical protein AJ80_00721 [Polytolypa hystricis UAMH7299]|uniref:Rhodanese domain-containing protein n=1 Tax=Polytolypa hystricis (strain UAMH7299) TaxID=1447883 RepID=A0A2B7Z2B4_POLH7|nr:hypothetical protein AJ80_00721 [Polytolypa hystricis UAMH7299]